MPEPAGMSRGVERKQIGAALHDLCQPLTTLQCRLEMAGLIDTLEAYREAVEVGMQECLRVGAQVASIRAILRAPVEQALEQVLDEEMGALR
jgi:hypothetical protein